MSEVKIVTYEEVKAMADEPEKLLVDVRNPDELQEVGKIPHSLNIPLPTLEEALNLSEEEFKEKFGRDKPAKEQEVVFHCKMGGRAGKATELAMSLGFTNAKSYKGSFQDWCEKEKL